MSFCGKCGKQSETSMKFCSNCGAPLMELPLPPPPPDTETPQSSPLPPPPPPAQNNSGESIMGVLLLRKSKSFGRYDTYTGVVTNQRFIFAQMTSQMVTQAVKDAQQQAKADGKGFFGQWANQLKASFGYTQRYLTMQPDAILAETPGNYAYNNSTISEVKLKLKNLYNNNDQVQSHEFELEVKSAMGKSEFKMDENNDYVKMLKSVYGDKVKMPFGYFSKGGFNIKIGF
ncbi:MAG: zinc ribbon domain-containing protein [Candidatus Bathyarchaeota archaeon]|nr:zinc ribbon domain-containing protein [Candidatus Bathyarchaeota archaeon]